jgi:NhaA family Na+:H+ antiporter
MAAPAAIFLALNIHRESAAGWAVPMATDIAFAVGVLALLGKRVAPALRILLLALAVIDDVGAIAIIAVFYSAGPSLEGFAILGAGIAAVVAMQALGIRSTLAYGAPSIVIWTGAYLAGIHPTIAGVIVGFMTPVTAYYGAERFLDQIEFRIRSLRSTGVPHDRELVQHLDRLQIVNREAISPVERLEYRLHNWVAFGIMPLFALANAGVPLGDISFEGDAGGLFWGITLGLAVGKPLGILAVAWLAARIGAAVLPAGVKWSHVSVIGIVGGIGFTMALFIAQLAFTAGPLLETAKLAILCGSGAAGMLSLIAGHRILQTDHALGRAGNESEAEAQL